MKEYPNNPINTRTDTNSTTFVQPSKGSKQPSANAQAVFIPVGLLDPHVLQSDLLAKHDDFIERCFKEWEAWVNDYNSRAFQRRQYPPYTPTDFPKP